MNSYSLYLGFAALITLSLAAVCYRRGALHGARPFAILLLAVTVWSAAYGLEINSNDLAGIKFWVRIEYIGIVFIPVFWLAFALQYTGNYQWLTRRNWILITVEPALALALFWTNDLHELFWRDVVLVDTGDLVLATFTHGAGFWINAAYSYLLLFIGAVLIIQSLVRSRSLFRKQGLALLAGVLAPWLGNAIYLSGVYPIQYLDPTPFAFTITGVTITWGLLLYQFLEIVPVARASLVTNMSDGMIVLDAKDRIVDLNPAAVQMIGQPLEKAVGQDPGQFFLGQEQLIRALSSAGFTSAEMAIGQGYDQRYYDLRASPLVDGRGNTSGRLIVLRDITERKISEEALDRRRAILEAVSFTATKFLKTLAWEDVIIETLERLGISAGVSRAYIFEIDRSEGGSTLASQRYEWVAAGMTPQIENSGCQGFNLQEAGLGRWEAMLRQGEPVFGRMDEFPAAERELLQAQKILGIAVLPVFVGEQLWGVIGYDDCVYPRRWSQAEIDALAAAARIFGSSIQRKITEDRQRQRSNELAILYEVSLEIASSQEKPQLLQMIVERAVELIGGTGGGLYLCDPVNREVRCVTSTNTLKDFSGIVLKYGQGASGIVAQTGQPLIIDDYASWEGRAVVYEEDQPFRSILSAPLSWLGEVIGVIHILHNQETARFNKDDLKLLTSFANQAAIALHNANAYQVAQKRSRMMALLHDITIGSLEIADLTRMLEYLAARMAELLDADGCSISLWNDSWNREIPSVNFGSLAKITPEGCFNPDDMRLLAQTMDTSQSIIIEDVSETPLINKKLVGDFPAKSLISIPLIAQGQYIGAALVTYDEKHSFTQDELIISELAAAQLALAVAKTRLLETERRRGDELDALRATMTDISGELELSALLRIILERATTLLNATGGDLGLYEEDREEIVIVVSHNMGRDYHGTRMALSEGAMGRAVKNNEPVIVSNYHQWEGRSLQYDEGPWDSVLAVPLNFHGRLVGALGIVDKNPKRKFTAEDQRLLDLFAQQAAAGIENARLYAEEKQRVKELEILYESSASITKTLDLNLVYSIAANQLARAVDATSSYIMSCDLKSGEATVLASYTGPLANENERVSDIGTSYDLRQFQQTFAALQDGRPITIKLSDPDIDPSDLDEFKRFNLKTTICIPMIVSDNLIGYAEVWESREERSWSDEEIRICQTIANQAAVAIENARLYNEIQNRAVTDSLTGIYNRRGLFDIGQREIGRARRFERPLSAILLDIDHFKLINDEYSHAVGDQVLKHITKVCLLKLRNTDIFGRYGGEEFAIILPEIDHITAYRVAERLRRVVASKPMQTDSGAINITISLGIAGLTGDIDDLAVLLDRADTAMYAAKRAGRNRVVVDGVSDKELELMYTGCPNVGPMQIIEDTAGKERSVRR